MNSARIVASVLLLLLCTGVLAAQEKQEGESFRENLSIGLYKEMRSFRDFISPWDIGFILPVSEVLEVHIRAAYRDPRWKMGNYGSSDASGTIRVSWEDPYSAIDYHIAAVHQTEGGEDFSLQAGLFFSAVHIVEGDQGLLKSLSRASFANGILHAGGIIGVAWNLDEHWRLSLQYRPKMVITSYSGRRGNVYGPPEKWTELQTPVVMQIALKPF